MSDLSQDGELEVQEVHGNDRILEQFLIDQSFLDQLRQLTTSKPLDMQLAQDREIDITIDIHQIALFLIITDDSYLIVRDGSIHTHRIGSASRHVEGQRQLRILTVHDNTQSVISMDDRLVFLDHRILL